jgi:phenylalanyl-tRNA synthetase beta chain
LINEQYVERPSIIATAYYWSETKLSNGTMLHAPTTFYNLKAAVDAVIGRSPRLKPIFRSEEIKDENFAYGYEIFQGR